VHSFSLPLAGEAPRGHFQSFAVDLLEQEHRCKLDGRVRRRECLPDRFGLGGIKRRGDQQKVDIRCGS
jgi:hypothetical protein